jgi:O-antigen/teichoic acid export membrane protein
MKDESYDEIKKYVKPYSILFTLIFIIMLFIGPEALKILGPKKYWSGIWVIPPVVLGIYFQFIYSLYVNIEFYLKKTKFISIGTIIAALLNIILNYFFIPLYGYIAAAYTTLASYIILFILHFIIANRWIKKDVFAAKFIFSTIFIVTLLTIIATLFYNNIIVRYSVLLIIIVIVILIFRKSFYRLIKRIKDKKDEIEKVDK